MTYLNMEETQLKASGALSTAKEIAGQPTLWKSIFERLVVDSKEISGFIDLVLQDAGKIILTGAGTSAYIGHSVEGAMQRKLGVTTVSVPTTHLVSHPQDYFQREVSTLLVSFARSGDSPESLAAVNLADSHIDRCFHLVITCNEQGGLAKYKAKEKSYVVLLPPQANDKSLAMTGSYSGMLLAAILLCDYRDVSAQRGVVDAIVDYGNQLLGRNVLGDIKGLAGLDFDRAVFLGSGPLFGTAMESHLKLQELTDGDVVCKNDSYLGFRHGPKAVVNERTLLVYYFSNNAKVLRYEKDLVEGMAIGKRPLKQVGISTVPIDGLSVDTLIVLGEGQVDAVPEEFLCVCFILFGQLLGLFKSLHLGLEPDSPSKSGAISRVVQGVKIYQT
ncbi:sugar isomerase [Flagellimonas halotolerans]|uniref:Sugar isomerase n=1 Tax=Flagellimonas halotolerans TaxID=3112164 RepID=A0ABU6ISQ6_9FLAO|nr:MULTISPECIES: sugar isomerase [unclassified Allomuricauda]MEC3966208.1 sugar isomerase [Muricauda sp. SYSU M86414]MEC4266106.1 sugar isomerase [Muricauda sp. SYSU M84420]